MFRRVTCSSSVLVATSTPSRSLGEYNFGHPPLSKEYKAVAKVPRKTAENKGIQITKLNNGARVISHDMDGALSSVGAYIRAGAKYDPRSAPGLSYVMRFALTTSNYDNSLFQIDRTVRSTGVAFQHLESRKEYIGLRVDGRRDMWKPTAANIFTCIAAPRFHESDIERYRDTMDNLLKEQRWLAPREYAVEQLESVAFYKEPLGNPRMVPEFANDLCSSQKLLEQYSRVVVPSNVIIAGINVDHGELIAEYENAPFPHSNNAPHHAHAAAENAGKAIDTTNEQKQYIGGEHHEQESRAKEMGTKPDMDPETIVACGFLTYGRESSAKDYASSLVAQQLLNVAYGVNVQYNHYATTQGVRSFYSPFNTAGLLGFSVVCDPSAAVKSVIDAAKAVQSLNVQNLDIAKSAAASAFTAENIETVRGYCDYLGTSVAASTTQYVKAQEILEAIQNVSAADIARVQQLATSHKPSMYAHGETLALPSMRQMGF